MARTVRVVLNRKGVGELLRSDAVGRILQQHANRIAGAAGPGHRVELDVGRKRARAAVITETIEAKIDEAKHRTLTRAVGTG